MKTLYVNTVLSNIHSVTIIIFFSLEFMFS